MILVRQATGPTVVTAGVPASYRATAFDQPNPSPADLAAINWEVQCDGATLARFPAQGPSLDYVAPAEAAGKSILVMPFANSPTPTVSVTSLVRGAEEPVSAPASVALRIEGQDYFATVNEGAEFYVGTDVAYLGRRGLMNTRQAPYVYSPSDWRAAYGFWADVILPTAMCESRGSFNCLNTYDRAAFTFDFYQHAAHTPNANFVLELRRFLALSEAPFYFPDLAVIGGRVNRQTPSGWQALESTQSTQALMDYLNPDPDAVGTEEATVAAKFVHWAQNSAAMRETQVAFTIEQQRQNYAAYAQRYALDGADDRICIVVADIRHQGRAGSDTIIAALKASDPLQALLGIGAADYAQRIAELRGQIDRMTAAGILGRHSYSLANKDFVAD